MAEARRRQQMQLDQSRIQKRVRNTTQAPTTDAITRIHIQMIHRPHWFGTEMLPDFVRTEILDV